MRQGYIEIESPHPRSAPRRPWFQPGPGPAQRRSFDSGCRPRCQYRWSISIPISAATPSPPNIWSTAATCSRCSRSWGTPLRRWSGVMSTWLRTLSGSRPHSSAGARRGETHEEIRDQIALAAMCVHRATLVLTCNAAADGRASASGAGTPCGERDERVPVAVRDETVRSTGSLDTPQQHCLPILTGPLPGKSYVCISRVVLGNAGRRPRTRLRPIAECEREPLAGGL